MKCASAASTRDPGAEERWRREIHPMRLCSVRPSKQSSSPRGLVLREERGADQKISLPRSSFGRRALEEDSLPTDLFLIFLPSPQGQVSIMSAAASDNTAVAPAAFFLLTPDELESRFNTNVQLGLPASAIAALQARDGPNELNGGGGVSILAILAGQVFNAMVRPRRDLGRKRSEVADTRSAFFFTPACRSSFSSWPLPCRWASSLGSNLVSLQVRRAVQMKQRQSKS